MKKLTCKRVLNSKEFKKLKNIGGHKVYHQEGNAFRHSILVWRAAKREFRGDHTMVLVALLHDIGKIYTSVREGKADWTYPNHSVRGGEVLHKFMPKDDPRYEQVEWYITNHIKPLFWKTAEDAKKLEKRAPEGCSVKNLARLALCDLKGSYAIPSVDNSNQIALLKAVAGK